MGFEIWGFGLARKGKRVVLLRRSFLWIGNRFGGEGGGKEVGKVRILESFKYFGGCVDLRLRFEISVCC